MRGSVNAPLVPQCGQAIWASPSSGGWPCLLLVGLDQLVGAEPPVAGQALGQRVDELGEVPAGLPDLGGEDHRGVEPDDVLALVTIERHHWRLMLFFISTPSGP